jgi:hypothetical protein
MSWIHLAQDRVQWQALVNMGMNLLDFIKCGGFLNYPSNCHLPMKDSALFT